jgi:hypothetical protein
MIILYLKYEHLKGVVSIKLAEKGVKWTLNIVKIGKIFMFYHSKPWKS